MPKVAAVMTRVSGAVAAATSPRPSTPSACARIGALTRTANGGKKLPIRVCSMWPATSPGPFFGVAAFAVVAGADAAGADVAGADVADADVAELASTGVFAESAMAAVVAAVAAVAVVAAVGDVADVEACATETGADEMVNDGWVAP